MVLWLLLIISALVFKNAQFRYVSNISRYHVECEIYREILYPQRTHIILLRVSFYLILYVRTIENISFASISRVDIFAFIYTRQPQ